MSADFKAVARAALADADKAFADTGDVMVAIQWIAFAAKAGEPVPPHMADWLHRALQDYRNGPAALKMDEAMGLNKRAKAQPRRRWREALDLNDALGRMWFLIAARATREQAAALVAALTDREVEQLRRSYSESWFARRTDDPFVGMCSDDVRDYVVMMLADYPDGIETRQEKAAILARFPASDPLRVKGRFAGWVGVDPDDSAAS